MATRMSLSSSGPKTPSAESKPVWTPSSKEGLKIPLRMDPEEVSVSWTVGAVVGSVAEDTRKKTIRRMPLRRSVVSDIPKIMPLDLDAVEAGVPLSEISSFVKASGIELKNIYDIVIPSRTLKHRRARKETLNIDESDKLARLIRVFEQAVRVFGDSQNARDWLTEAKKRFEGRTPLQMLRTDFGGRMVEEMLGQIDEGMFA